MKNIIYSIASLIIISSLSSFTTFPDVNTNTKWEKLGSRLVDYRLDKDVIHIGKVEGPLSKLKIAITGSSLNMHKMKIVYQNGQVENINLKQRFNKRSASRIIDLEGRKRIIKNIVFCYDTNNRSKKKARITVFGR